MFLDIDYSSNVLTNTFEQYTISMNWLTPLQNLTIDDMVEKARELIFDFKYPFYTDEAQAKEEFEKMFILMHLRDNWGVETAGEFKYWLQRKLTLVSDGYRQLYETMKFEYNPIENHNLERTVDRSGKAKETNINSGVINNESNTDNTVTGNSHTTGDRTSNNQNIHSDNPQVNFSGQDYASNMDRGQTKDATETNTNDSTTGKTNFNSKQNNNNTENSDSEYSNNEKYTEHGYLGNVQDAIKKERELIVNINRMLCEEMNDLFLLVLM